MYQFRLKKFVLYLDLRFKIEVILSGVEGWTYSF